MKTIPTSFTKASLTKTSLITALIGSFFTLSACDRFGQEDQADRPESAREFPRPYRPVSEVVGNRFWTEAKRDEAGEAELLMDWADIEDGMTVADLGAGEGYYTVRLSKRVGNKGRVLAQDIDADALKKLATRVGREEYSNVAIQKGDVDNPKLPKGSFDRVFMVHMYHEVTEPYAFLWQLYPALAESGEVIVVDRDYPTDQHGIPPRLLFCEFEALGYTLTGFSEQLNVGGYFAKFEANGERPDPSKIEICKDTQ